MGIYNPKTVPPVPEDFKPGNEYYDKSNRLSKLIGALSEGLYQGQYQDFNVFYAFVFNNLNRTVKNLTAFERKRFDKVMAKFRPGKVQVLKPVLTEQPVDWPETRTESQPNPKWPGKDQEEFIDVEVPNIFEPTVVDYENVDGDEDDWEGLLMDYTIDAKGWVYEAGTHAIPFLEKYIAPYHHEKLQEACFEDYGNAVKLAKDLDLVKELDIEFQDFEPKQA